MNDRIKASTLIIGTICAIYALPIALVNALAEHIGKKGKSL